MKIFLIFILSFFTSANCQIYTQADIDVCNSKFELAVKKDLSKLPINMVIAEIGKSFIGVDYEAGTLDKSEKETLTVNLTGLDCYTFLENTLVIARLIKSDSMTFENYLQELISIRYRCGELKEYPSRLHYFSDWIFEMDKRNIAKDITKDIGGKSYPNNVSFMSSNPKYYKQLENNPDFVNQMKKIEQNISSREYYYIPEDEISKYEKNISSGDIIGITTNIKGLDISHVGLAIRMDDDRIHLLHAPNKDKKVQISEVSLSDYIKHNSKQTGIIVVRPVEP